MKSYSNHETADTGGTIPPKPVEHSKRTITMSDGRYMIFYTEKSRTEQAEKSGESEKEQDTSV